jgi:hypothetical protein
MSIVIVILILLLILCGTVFAYLVLRPVKYDGTIFVETTEEGKTMFSLEIDKDPDLLRERSVIIFKVIDNTVAPAE